MGYNINITRIKAVYNALGELKDEVVFVGGATVVLYVDRNAAEEARPTDDVDILVELLHYGKAYDKLIEKLVKLGFQPDKESPIICRYNYQGITVDIMTTGEDVMGFSNIWYPEGFKNSIEYKIDEQHTIRVFSSAYFIASKLEAFKGRGNNDGRTSQDFEDIIFVLDNRDTVWGELREAPENVKAYLKQEFSNMLKEPGTFEEWVYGHLERSTAQTRMERISESLGVFVKGE